MSSLSELYSKRTKYRNVRENVTYAINVLSSNNSIDDCISSAQSVLSNSYLINDVICKGTLLADVMESVNADLKNLETCFSSINSRIYELSNEIEKKEAEEMLG